MLEIIIIIAVVKTFVKKAKEKNFNHVLWGFIGAGSYYIPILLMSFVVLPFLISSGNLSFPSESNFLYTSIAINLVVGISCCFMMYQLLKNSKARVQDTDAEILDSELN
ncbi:MAG: hypothetical protein AAF487_09400 [Bacteroidota bacterium]